MTDTNPVWAQIQQGDLKQFESIFRAWYKPLCAYANKFFGNMDEAENVVQELFCDLWQRRESIRIQDQIRPYLYRAVFNRCLNAQRQMARLIPIDAADLQHRAAAPTGSQVETAQLEQMYLDAVLAMPEGRRKIFSLSRFEGKSYREIADYLDISVKTVEAQMGKALGHLRVQLADYLVLVIGLLGFVTECLRQLTLNLN